MPFVFLLLFALICLQPSWPKWFEWPTPEACAILVGSLVIASWMSAWLIAKAISWQMVRHPEQRNLLMRRYNRWRRWHFIALLTAFLVALYPLAWGNVLATWWTETVPSFLQSKENLPGFHLVLLAPFVLAMLAAWERFYGVEKTAYEQSHVDDRFLPKRSYLVMQVRHQFFLVVPPILLMVSLQFLYLFLSGPDDISDLPALVMIAIMMAALVLMPLLLRVFLGLKPLPPGPLRDRLESAATRLNFRFSNILVWNTRHMMANALVTGFVPWIRYIVLTDRLIEELTPDEIEAVFGHEVGHVKHHHLLFYLAFFLTSFILLSIFWDRFKYFARQEQLLEWVPSPAILSKEDLKETLVMLSGFGKLLVLGGYTLLFFGFISRRCERQADLFGSHTVSTDVFISALEKVAVLNGIPRDRVGNWLLSWQHPTIAQRVDFLRAMRDDPTRIPQFHRSITMLKWGFLLALVFLVCWVGPTEVWKVLKDF